MFNRSTSTVEQIDPELYAAIPADNHAPDNEAKLAEVRAEVAVLARRFPVYGPNAG
jgi:hypothetical protein